MSHANSSDSIDNHIYNNVKSMSPSQYLLSFIIINVIMPLEYWNVTVDLRSMALCHTLRNPNDVPALLLLEFDVGVEDAKVELLQEGILHQ